MGHIHFPQFRKARGGIRVHPGLTILDYIRQAGIEIAADCGGNGTCGKCVVRVEEGGACLRRPTGAEKRAGLDDRERLACQARILRDEHDIVVYLRSFGRYEILNYGMERDIPLAPAAVRSGGRVLIDGKDADAYRGAVYGVALDVGTTTVVFDVVDLQTGDIVATTARTNPQISYGNDVISRIDYASVDKGASRYLDPAERAERVGRLRHTVIAAVNESLADLSGRLGEDVGSRIYETVVVGNCTMRNLFFGLDVSSLGVKPFEPERPCSLSAAPESLGLAVNPRGRVYGAALIGGHVGADILADVMASGMYKSPDVCMLVDIGTNGEIVVGNRDRLLCASAAAGGAFEGTAIACGIGAVEGAIKSVEIADGRAMYSTIGNKHPVGVCGSGLIDLLAQLLKHGLMTPRARLSGDFPVAGSLKIGQEDVFQLITSKAAVKTGEEILCEQYPVAPEKLAKVYLSGGFGNFIDTANAAAIGLLPPVDGARVEKIGNGALEGAREMLLCAECRALSERIAREIRHVRTNEAAEDFDYRMAANMYFE